MLNTQIVSEFDSNLATQNITQRKHTQVTQPATIPNLFFAGAAKAGTTSLWYYFKDHPEVFLPKDEINKEPGYFSKLANLAKFDMDRYLKLFEDATEQHKYVGEASTAYLSDPETAKRLHQFNPNAKIVLILRNPVERAYSLYNWMRQEGYEWAHSFEQGLRLESWRAKKSLPSILHPNYYYNYLYFQSGLYSKQVKRYLDLFGHEQVLILTFKELKDNTQGTIDKICDFLEVSKFTIVPEARNVSKKVASGKMQYALRLLTISKFVLEKHLAGKRYSDKDKRDRLLQLGLVNAKPKPISKKTKQELKEMYRSDILKLSKLTGKDFSFWLE